MSFSGFSNQTNMPLTPTAVRNPDTEPFIRPLACQAVYEWNARPERGQRPSAP